MSLPRYPEYKDSGADWLGSVPAHWDTWKLRHAFGSIGSGTTPPSDEPHWYDAGTIPWITTGELRETVICETTKSVTPAALQKFSTLKLHPKGALAIAMYGATIGRLGVLGVDAVTNQACCVLSSPRSLNVSFVFYWLLGFKQRIIDLYATGGGQPNINQETISSLRIPAPNLSEQTAIAAFLDRETAKIDALIAEQEKLIALLAEKRQATISHAVTRGLNPDAPMKDSGVAWLGEVPVHWEVFRLGALFREVNESGNDSLPVLSVSIHDGVSDKELDEAELDRKVTRSDDRSKYKAVAPGDLTYNMMRAWQGGFGSVAVMGMVSPAYVVARPTADFLTTHVECVLRTPQAVAEMKRHSRGITDFRLRLYWEEFKTIQIALPPKTEQLQLAEFIQDETSKQDSLRAEAERAITLLKERRSALIAAAVTGQIYVRSTAHAEA